MRGETEGTRIRRGRVRRGEEEGKKRVRWRGGGEYGLNNWCRREGMVEMVQVAPSGRQVRRGKQGKGDTKPATDEGK